MDHPLRTVFAGRRKELNVTQEHLAKVAGVGLRTLKAFEAKSGNPTLETLMRLADALGLELSAVPKNLPPADYVPKTSTSTAS